MESLMVVLGIVGLFIVRIGIPVLLLTTLGIIIDRWQNKREEQLKHATVHKH